MASFCVRYESVCDRYEPCNHHAFLGTPRTKYFPRARLEETSRFVYGIPHDDPSRDPNRPDDHLGCRDGYGIGSGGLVASVRARFHLYFL
mgnify:FL=1